VLCVPTCAQITGVGLVADGYILMHLTLNCFRNEASINILVCSRGGGGLLVERMELVAELWQENFKVDISKQF
jgi:hypothetical protein